MLLLSRKVDQDLILILPSGEQVEIKLVSVQSSDQRAKLGITAPPSVAVWRKELLKDGIPETLPTRRSEEEATNKSHGISTEGASTG